MNLRHSMPAVALLTAFVAAIGRGESPPDRPVLTLTDSIEMGLEQAAAARNARRDEAIAGKRIGQVRAQLLPQLKATGRYTRLDEVEAFEFDGERFEMGREDTYAAGVEASQLLYSGGSVGAALKAARLYLDVARCLTITSKPMTTSAPASSRLSAPFIQR